jgi:hypothetical protein
MLREHACVLVKNRNTCISEYTSISDDVLIHRAKILGVSLGASTSQVKDSIHNIKETDNNRTLIMIQKNLAEDDKDKSSHSDAFHHANSLSTDLGEDGQLSPEEKSPVREAKGLKVYKRREKVVPKAVRRSSRLNKKYK